MVEKLNMALPMFSVICTARYVQHNKRRERERDACKLMFGLDSGKT